MLAKMGRTGDAIHQAADVVMRFDASTAALQLLKDACASTDPNQRQDIVAVLNQLRKEHPSESPVTRRASPQRSGQDRRC